MNTYKPPCAAVECPSKARLTQEFCTALGERILDAGGAGLLEIQRCPYDALMSLIPISDSPEANELKSRLGLGLQSYQADTD